MAAKKKSPAPEKSGSGLWMALGGAAAVLLLCIVCSGGAIGVWYWKNPLANKDLAKGLDVGKRKDAADRAPDADKRKGPLGKIVDGAKAIDPIPGTGPLAKVPLTDLDADSPFWDFTLRPPKGSKMTGKEIKLPGPEECYTCQWMRQNPVEGTIAIDVTKIKLQGTPPEPILLFANAFSDGKFKSEPTEKYQFEVLHKPQAVELNGLRGARYWVLRPQGPERFGVGVHYRFHIDGWGYLFVGQCFGKTAEQARRNAELTDASICTFRKR